MSIAMDIHANWVRVSCVLSVEVNGFVGLAVLRENDFLGGKSFFSVVE